MLRWAAIFFFVAFVAALFGFAGRAGGAAGPSKIVCYVRAGLARQPQVGPSG
jgi:uncharacterized membrane protein YtjA (UPF0391 family)